MSAKIYIEGGGDSKELHTRCREGFRRLLEKSGFAGRMPRLVACGSRNDAFDGFVTAHANASPGDYVALLVDSEVPLADVEKTWAHLKRRDDWEKPAGADDEQALLMTTCMETWIVSDQHTLRNYYGKCLQENALPNQINLESRARDEILDVLVHATRTCKAGFAKGKRSFEIVGRLDPAALRSLPSFLRCERVLGAKL